MRMKMYRVTKLSFALILLFFSFQGFANPYSIAVDSFNENLVNDSLFVDSVKYLKVIDGRGSGYYKVGDTVNIEAYRIAGFLKWTGDIFSVDDAFSYSTYLIMPDVDIIIQPEFRPDFSIVTFRIVDYNEFYPAKKVKISIDENNEFIIDSTGIVKIYMNFGDYLVTIAILEGADKFTLPINVSEPNESFAIYLESCCSSLAISRDRSRCS